MLCVLLLIDTATEQLANQADSKKVEKDFLAHALSRVLIRGGGALFRFHLSRAIQNRLIDLFVEIIVLSELVVATDYDAKDRNKDAEHSSDLRDPVDHVFDDSCVLELHRIDLELDSYDGFLIVIPYRGVRIERVFSKDSNVCILGESAEH